MEQPTPKRATLWWQPTGKEWEKEAFPLACWSPVAEAFSDLSGTLKQTDRSWDAPPPGLNNYHGLSVGGAI